MTLSLLRPTVKEKHWTFPGNEWAIGLPEKKLNEMKNIPRGSKDLFSRKF